MTTRRAHGFTLLELLVAITLLGVLMAALFGALRLGARVWETGAARQDASARIQLVQDFLRRQLGQTVPLTERGDPRAAEAMLFEGRAQSVRFVSLLPEHLDAGAGLMELAVRPPAGTDPAALILRWRPLDLLAGAEPQPGAGPQADAEEHVLIEGIERLELAYFGAGASDRAPAWWQEWQGQRTLPALVRVRVGFPAGDARVWPELVVRLMIDLPPPLPL